MKFLQDMQAKTGETPAALLRRPPLRPDCELYYEAFLQLDQGRDSNGYGFNPIRISETLAWLTLTGTTGEEREKVLRLVQVMDQAFLKYQADKNKN